MLIALTLVLVPERDVVLPATLGRANHAATLHRLAVVDPALAEALHAGDGPKPFTCSGIRNAPVSRNSVRFRRGERYEVRITGLTTAVSQALHAALLETPPATWELEHYPFRVEEVICDPARDGWTGRSDYATLAAAALLKPGKVDPAVTLEFASPTAFKSAGMTVPIPLPALVFGESLPKRWQAFSPVALDDELRAYSDGYIAITRYRLESRPVEQKQRGLRVGGMGRVTYRALEGDRYWLGMMQALAGFALYSGVGAMTTSGMGQARRVEDP
ncbi:MAG: CRISPR-associated endoribonuclease Cas6 [Caldilineaceae bacterium]|nr:CRISPR-associated endoribonuclease Cas6 [Caldilineaceae bacterium]